MGIDVHKENWQVTIRAEGEEIFKRPHPGTIPIVEEIAGPLSRLTDEGGI